MSAAESDVVVDLMLNDSPAPNAFDELKATTERVHILRRPTCCASFWGSIEGDMFVTDEFITPLPSQMQLTVRSLLGVLSVEHMVTVLLATAA